MGVERIGTPNKVTSMDWNADGAAERDAEESPRPGETQPTPSSEDPEIQLESGEPSHEDPPEPEAVAAESRGADVLDVEVGSEEPSAPAPPPASPSGPYAQGPGQWAYVPPPTPPAPPARRGMSGCLIALLVGLGLLVVGGLVITIAVGTMGGGQASTGFSAGGDKVAVIYISGVISDGGEEVPLFGPAVNGSRSVMAQLREAGKDSTVKAILLHINSPGGSAAASQSIYQEVVRVQKDHNKPVVAAMGDVCASGGYYIASAAKSIIASPATLTGSIGVIMQSINWSGLAEKYGVKGETVKSGPYKDSMSPFRAMREDERALMQTMVNDVYDQFVEDVDKGRGNLKRAQVRKLADGRVYTGRQAKKAGLVDELGNYHDALAAAAKAGGIQGEPQVKTYGRSRGLYGLLSERSLAGSQFPAGMNVPLPRPLGPGIWLIWEGEQTLEAE